MWNPTVRLLINRFLSYLISSHYSASHHTTAPLNTLRRLSSHYNASQHTIAPITTLARLSPSTCEEKFKFFQRTMEELMVTHFPYKSVTRHAADKPWVTDYFRHLTRQRQRAIMSGDIDEARRLRNLVNRTAPKLRQRFYQSKIATLEETSSKDWWKTHEESDGRSIR